MKLAIPVFHTKISPRFDQAQGFVLLETKQAAIMAREGLATRGWSEIEKMRQLVDLGIETLICGGIDRASLQYLSFNGISVYSWVTGEVEDAVTCYLDNRMKPGIILGKQGKMVGRWQFCKGRNHLCNMFQTGLNNGKEGVINMPRGRPYKCPYDCGSTNTVSKGVRRTKTMGVRKLRLCKTCGRKFTPVNQKPEPLPEAEP